MNEQSLRARTLQAYLSTSSGAHLRMQEADRNRYIGVYTHYLRAWLPRTRGRWVDLGAGQGALLRLARQKGFDVQGVDASPECVAVCEDQDLPVTLGDAVEFLSQLPDGACTVISCFDLLEHMSKDEGFKLLAACRRALAKNGVCLVKLPNADSPMGFSVTAGDLTHEVAYTPATLQQIARLAGFCTFQMRELSPVPSTPRRAVRTLAWQLVRRGIQLFNVIETGSAGSGIYTRVFLARLS